MKLAYMFCSLKRHHECQYFKAKYGESCVCQCHDDVRQG